MPRVRRVDYPAGGRRRGVASVPGHVLDLAVNPVLYDVCVSLGTKLCVGPGSRGASTELTESQCSSLSYMGEVVITKIRKPLLR